MNKKAMLCIHTVLTASAFLGCSAIQAQTLSRTAQPVYNDVFISYYSAANVNAMADFAKNNQLGGFILWEIRGDTPYTDKKTSLLATLAENVKDYKVNGVVAPLSMGYWTNWGLYSDNADSTAIPQPAYPIPGSIASHSQTNTPDVTNSDFTEKLEGMNVVTYSFVEVQAKKFTYYDTASGKTYTIDNKTPEKIGTLYFNDPWADLQVSGTFTKQDELCKLNSAICDFSLKNRIVPIASFDAGAKMGNFNAFSKIAHTNSSNPLGPLKRIFSVGGYAHDDSFEDAFSPTGITNFTTSAAQIINTYNLDGIDLDYENPNMTWEQSEHYLALVQALRKALPGKFISVTIMTDPGYIAGTRAGNVGFKPGIFSKIAAEVNYINLMTYDFHGAFDYSADGKGTTGFLTNLYQPENKPENYQFSVEESVKAALGQHIPRNKLNIGIPAYGRALGGIDAGKNNDGLFQPIKSTSSIPKGDFDAAHCNTAITPLSFDSCNGNFSYHYIMKNMVGKGFVERSDIAQGASNGVSAYSKQWSPPQTSYKLVIKNIGSASDDAGFNVSAGSFAAPDYFGLGAEKSYFPMDIMNKTALSVRTKYWNGELECPGKLDFTSDTEVDILVRPENGVYGINCTFKQL